MRKKDKVIECAEDIIDYVVARIIMERVNEDFGKASIQMANEVYEQVKLRM
mgnify:CR=1 FL=1|tara:strand:+ start:352 stop:504 length:153 start_codon:yes stop_codon:yes gene_type:complete